MRTWTLPLAAGAMFLAGVTVADAQTYEGPLPPVAAASLAEINAVPSTPLPQSAIGKNIMTTRNDVAGQIVALRDEGPVVSVGQYLEQGPRVVIVPRAQVFTTGQGADLQVSTFMSKKDIGSLVDFKTPATASTVRN